jgi:hypothetical protein
LCKGFICLQKQKRIVKPIISHKKDLPKGCFQEQ